MPRLRTTVWYIISLVLARISWRALLRVIYICCCCTLLYRVFHVMAVVRVGWIRWNSFDLAVVNRVDSWRRCLLRGGLAIFYFAQLRLWISPRDSWNWRSLRWVMKWRLVMSRFKVILVRRVFDIILALNIYSFRVVRVVWSPKNTHGLPLLLSQLYV